MNTQLTQQYDSLYESQDDVFGEGKPLPAVVQLAEFLLSGTVLDIGGGEGRNALYLARAGYDVTVTDLSQVGIQKLLAVAEAEGLRIRGKVSDVTIKGIAGSYDALLCTFVMHHLAVDEAVSLITEMQNHTNDNGIHIVATFLHEGELAERNKRSASGRFYPSQEEVMKLYAGWEMLFVKVRETTTHAKDKEGNRMQNQLIVLIARKPAKTA